VQIGHGGRDDVLVDESARGGKATIEIKRCDDGFDGVGEDRGLLAATALLFSAAEQEMGAEVDAGGYFSEMTAADERGAKAGKLTFA